MPTIIEMHTNTAIIDHKAFGEVGGERRSPERSGECGAGEDHEFHFSLSLSLSWSMSWSLSWSLLEIGDIIEPPMADADADADADAREW